MISRSLVIRMSLVLLLESALCLNIIIGRAKEPHIDEFSDCMYVCMSVSCLCPISFSLIDFLTDFRIYHPSV